MKTFSFEAFYFQKMSPIFVGSEVVQSRLYQNVFVFNLLSYIKLQCVSRYHCDPPQPWTLVCTYVLE